MAEKPLYMQAPRHAGNCVIEGHEYTVPKNGKIKVVNPDHVGTLKRHGFTEILDEDKDELDARIEEMDDKDDLVEFIEERGGDADNSMGLKKLKKLARSAAGIEE